jgi:hypothetical protein
MALQSCCPAPQWGQIDRSTFPNANQEVVFNEPHLKAIYW